PCANGSASRARRHPMSDDYLRDRSGAPAPEVARLEGLLAPLAHTAPMRPRLRKWLVPVAMLAAASAVAIVLALPRPKSCRVDSGFVFSGDDVTCNGAAAATGVLPVGGVLATGEHGAKLAIANIGKAELGPHTQI